MIYALESVMWQLRALQNAMAAQQREREARFLGSLNFTHAERRAYESRVCGIDNRWQDYLRSKRK